ncbi:MAG: NAD-dependent epimerase/dehydratase family protein [Bacteroidetes bacterium]|nr:NAD-dependent epimerase/dehydratase family protein [Bacteroidota bacterium]
MRSVVITGSEGLIGHRLVEVLAQKGYQVSGVDLKNSTFSGGIEGDIRDAELMDRLIHNADGVIHLAAVSRVIDGQRNPELCHDVNVNGTRKVLDAVVKGSKKPWIIYASSREVYGDADSLPVSETHPIMPINVYGHSKVAAENMVNDFSKEGGVACILRFANVYGSTTRDHLTRVIPAFTRAAALGKVLHVEGSENTFDFTNLEDTVDGIQRVVDLIDQKKESLPPIHFLTGTPTTLGQLAAMAIKHGDTNARLLESPPRNYDVGRFYGSYERAKSLLGWEPKHSLEKTVIRMIKEWQAAEANQ